jgi:hypothetical protein
MTWNGVSAHYLNIRAIGQNKNRGALHPGFM